MTSAGRLGPKASEADRLRPGLEGVEVVMGVRAGALGVAMVKAGAP